MNQEASDYYSGQVFVNYGIEKGRGDIGARKPLQKNQYDITVSNASFRLSFIATRSKYTTFLLYMHNPETFTQSEEKKSRIEALLDDKPN